LGEGLGRGPGAPKPPPQPSPSGEGEKENGSYVVEFTYQKYRDWALPDELVFSFNTKDYKLPKGMTFDYEDDTKIDTTKVKNSKGEVRITFQNYVINKGVSDGVFK